MTPQDNTSNLFLTQMQVFRYIGKTDKTRRGILNLNFQILVAVVTTTVCFSVLHTSNGVSKPLVQKKISLLKTNKSFWICNKKSCQIHGLTKLRSKAGFVADLHRAFEGDRKCRVWCSLFQLGNFDQRRFQCLLVVQNSTVVFYTNSNSEKTKKV